MNTSLNRQSLLSAVLVTCGAIGCGSGARVTASQPTNADSSIVLDSLQRGQIKTEVVTSRRYNPVVNTTGTVTFNGDSSTQVISSISGPVSRLLVNLGDTVTAGQLLATVASPDFAGAVAEYRKTQTAWRNADRIAALDEKLFATDAIARTELEQARADLASADADREAALQTLRSFGLTESAVAALRDGKSVPGTEAGIRAPIGGAVVERVVNPGQLLQAGATPTFTIARLSTVWVLGNVFESDIASVHTGSIATIATDASSDSFTGRVDNVGALVDPGSKATAVRMVVSNRRAVLKQNMLVRVAIHGAESRTGILIPVAAVLRDDDNLPFVFIASGNGRFLRRRITLGGRIEENYQITDGLKTGETVVTQGALDLAQAAGQ